MEILYGNLTVEFACRKVDKPWSMYFALDHSLSTPEYASVMWDHYIDDKIIQIEMMQGRFC